MYAVNIADLTKYRGNVALMWTIRPLMVAGREQIDQNARLVDCEPGRLDGGGALLYASDERIQALVSLLRDILKIGKAELRVYYKTDRAMTWRRV